MARTSKYPQELRERAVRMVVEHRHEYPSQWKAIESVAEKLAVHRETLRVWVPTTLFARTRCTSSIAPERWPWRVHTQGGDRARDAVERRFEALGCAML